MRPLLILALLFSFSTAWAGSQGGDISGGGDPNIIWQREQAEARRKTQERRARQVQSRTNLITQLIQTGELKNRLIYFVKSAQSSVEKSTTLLSLIEKGLLADIEQSPYTVQSSCFAQIAGQSREVSLATRNGSSENPAIGSPICVSVRHLAENISSEEIEFSLFYAKLIGIFLHDHARHFGLMDEDHSFAQAMSDMYQKTSQIFYIGYPDTTLMEYVVPSTGLSSAEAHLQLQRNRTSVVGQIQANMIKSNECTNENSLQLARASYGVMEEVFFEPILATLSERTIYFNQDSTNLIDDGYRYIYASYRDPRSSHLLTGSFSARSQRPEFLSHHLPNGTCQADDVKIRLRHQNSIHSFEVLSLDGQGQKLPEVYINYRCPVQIDIDNRAECVKKESIPKKI